MTTKRFQLFMALMLSALLLISGFGALAEDAGNPEETVPDVHEAAHETTLMPRSAKTEPVDEDHHLVTVVYDLYCADCQRVVEENYRTDENLAAHVMADFREEPTCTMDGKAGLRCTACGQETDVEILPALGHEYPADGWRQTMAPTCDTAGWEENVCARCGEKAGREIPATGQHRFADAALLQGRGVGLVSGTDEYEGLIIGEVTLAPTCTETGEGALRCLTCQRAERPVTIPLISHPWGEWGDDELPDHSCTGDVTHTRVCQACGQTDTEIVIPAPGHQWKLAGMEEPTCTESGSITRKCAVCGEEETLEIPAAGHSYAWVDTVEPTHTSNGLREYKCAVCGDVADSQVIPYEEMYYNNTITSFGPTTRELIGGSSWYRVTPLDISGDGTFTYPLIASNRYTVGTATVIIEGGTQTVRYDLNLSPSQITVLSESLVIYPSLDSLRTGRDAAAFEFNTPINIAENFGDDPHIILGIILKADYNALASGVQDFIPDQKQIEGLIDLID